MIARRAHLLGTGGCWLRGGWKGHLGGARAQSGCWLRGVGRGSWEERGRREGQRPDGRWSADVLRLTRVQGGASPPTQRRSLHSPVRNHGGLWRARSKAMCTGRKGRRRGGERGERVGGERARAAAEEHAPRMPAAVLLARWTRTLSAQRQRRVSGAKVRRFAPRASQGLGALIESRRRSFTNGMAYCEGHPSRDASCDEKACHHG